MPHKSCAHGLPQPSYIAQQTTCSLRLPALAQALRPQLPIGLAAAMPAVASQPLALTLERLLLRSPAGPNEPAERWLEAVLAAYTAVAVLPAPPGEQAAAEQQLLSTLGGLQQAAALQSIAHSAAQQAVAAATAQLRQGYSRSMRFTAEQQQLREEALQQLTSSTCLQAAASAHLLAQRAQQEAESAALAAAAAAAAAGQQAEAPQQAAAQALSGLLHSPHTPLEVELLCLMALLPCWEGTLQRLAELHTAAAQQPRSTGDGSSCQQDAPAGAAQQAAAAAAVQLLCAACASQPQAVLRQHPALLAEVCRQSFRFTYAYAPLLAAQQRAAADDTRTAAEAARRQLAHATKHRDHVADYLLAKCSCSM